jgi:hypothetical protein
MGKGTGRWIAALAVVIGTVGVGVVGTAAPVAHAAGVDAQVGFGSDRLGTSWFQQQTQLTDQSITSSTFGQLFTRQTTTKGFAQPLIDANTLAVETSNNDIYGLNPTTGAVKWRHHLGTPFNPFLIGCGATGGGVGVTGTPVIDPTTHIEYLVYKTSDGSNWMDARQIQTGLEITGFPVEIEGHAANAPGVEFNSMAQLQRPGLLLLGGVVYAAFGSHCDRSTYEGWVVGVSETAKITTMWSDETTTGSDAGIWQGGGALISDAPGTMLLSTGNGDEPAAAANAAQAPGQFGNAVVRLSVNPDGTLHSSDFFIPYDAPYLDTIDGDLGSGAPVLLPTTPFSTAAHPEMAVEIGKEGYLYLLDAHNLGGYAQGASGGDAVIERLGPFGGVWGKPAVFGGAGGYIYLVDSSSVGGAGRLLAFKYGVDAQGRPSLAQVGQSTDAFAYGSSLPIVTSAAAPNGSGIVWVVWTPQTNSQIAQLRAYSAIPDASGTLDLLRSFPLKDGAEKMTEPLAFGNRIYVVGLTGMVYGFGAPTTTPLAADPLFLPDTVVGQSSTANLTLGSVGTHTLSAVSVSGTQFHLGTPAPALPVTLTGGKTLTVPVTFTPTTEGQQGATVTVTVDATTFAVGVEGAGIKAGPELSLNPKALSFGGTSPGNSVTSGATLADTGSQPMTITSVTFPSAPFTASGLPVAGTILQPGQSITAALGFAPAAFGQFTGNLTVNAGAAGTVTVALSGSSASPGQLKVTPNLLHFANDPVGVPVTKTFTVSNVGGTTVVVTKSQPPVANAYRAVTSLPEGMAISPGQVLTESVTFTPGSAATFHDKWVINATGISTAVQLQLVGTGT